jgi:hypothetical protein
VSVDSFEQLKNAYPSFYLNTEGFMHATRAMLGRQTEADKEWLKRITGRPNGVTRGIGMKARTFGKESSPRSGTNEKARRFNGG